MAQLLVPTDGAALRRNNFDAIRLAMALLVVWSHSFALWFGSESKEPVSLLMSGTYNSGNLAVLTFFTISGFLITFSWLRSNNWRRYILQRIVRIYPGYLVAISLCSLIVVPAFASRGFNALSASEVEGFASNLLLRNYIVSSDAFAGGAVNGSLWSIPYEFWCYLGVMALGSMSLLRWRLVYPLLAMIVMTVRVWLDMTGRRPGGGFVEMIIGFPYLWFNVLPPFLLGGTIYLYRNCVPRSGIILAFLVIVTISTANLPLSDLLRTAATRLLLPPTLTYLTFYVAFSPVVQVHNTARYGDFSYGTYLYAFPIQQMFVVLLKDRVSLAAYIFLSLVAALLAGVASWHLVEKWFLKRTRGVSALVISGTSLADEAARVVP